MKQTIKPAIRLASIIKRFWGRVAVTWSIVLVENALIALVPLFIGLSIDGLLSGNKDELLQLAMAMVVLGFVAVGRRIYDTRAYGVVRVKLGSEITNNQRDLEVSKRNARLDMSRELVDFLERDVPAIITAAIQVCVSFAILIYFDLILGFACITVVLAMIAVYSLFHGRFFKLNAALNAQKEQQVEVLDLGKKRGIFHHLRALRQHEVSLSDTEALLYGSIFLLQIAFIVFNLYFGAQLPDITAGKIFSITTYSWEFVEAALALPLTMQAMTRLSEITGRLNATE